MKTVGKWLGGITVAITIIVIAMLFIPKMIGLQPLVILNDSMYPTYKEGSLLYLKEAQRHKIKVGDPVVIQLEGGEFVLQRLTNVDEEKKNITAKADAHETKQEQVITSEQIIGTPLLTIPYAGYAAIKLNTPKGKVIFFTVIVCAYLATFIPNIINKKKFQ